MPNRKTECSPGQISAIDYYSPTPDHYSLTRVNSFQTNPERTNNCREICHKSLCSLACVLGQIPRQAAVYE